MVQWFEVAAMRRKHANFPKSVMGEADTIITADSIESGCLKRDRSGKAHVMFRTPYSDSRGHKGISKTLSYFGSQKGTMFGIHKKGEVGTVLFHCTTRYYNSGFA
jgi:hypothetical protein